MCFSAALSGAAVFLSRGQNTAVRDAANNVSSATYDLLGNVTRLAGPLGGATNYTYDDMGRLTSESTVSGGTKSYEYNELNLPKTVTDAVQKGGDFSCMQLSEEKN